LFSISWKAIQGLACRGYNLKLAWPGA